MLEQRPCIICDNVGSQVHQTEPKGSRNAEAKLARFFQLLGRHLDYNDDDDDGTGETWRVPFERIISADKISSCVECSKIVKSFCELYQEMKSIELQLNWKVWTLKNMLRPQGVTSQVRGELKTSDMIDFRRSLVAECDRKLKSSFPRLEIRKCGSINFPSSVKEEVNESSDDNLSHDNDETEFVHYNETTAKCEVSLDGLLSPSPIVSASPINMEGGRLHIRKQVLPASVLKIPSVLEIRKTVATAETQPNDDEDMMEEYPWAMEDYSEPVFQANEDEEEDETSIVPPIVIMPSEVPIEMQEPQGTINQETGSLQCQLCSKEFRDNSGLQHHHKSFHLKIRYRCSLCPKEYYHPTHYDRHYRSTHMRGSLIPCQLCTQRFISNAELIRHNQKIHLKPKRAKQFECPFCSMKFAQKCSVYRHRKVCPAANPDMVLKFECELCHEKFQSVRARTEHQEELHGGKMFACEYCGESFSIRQYKYVHKRTCPLKPI